MAGEEMQQVGRASPPMIINIGNIQLVTFLDGANPTTFTGWHSNVAVEAGGSTDRITGTSLNTS